MKLLTVFFLIIMGSVSCNSTEKNFVGKLHKNECFARYIDDIHAVFYKVLEVKDTSTLIQNLNTNTLFVVPNSVTLNDEINHKLFKIDCSHANIIVKVTQ